MRINFRNQISKVSIPHQNVMSHTSLILQQTDMRMSETQQLQLEYLEVTQMITNIRISHNSNVKVEVDKMLRTKKGVSVMHILG